MMSVSRTPLVPPEIQDDGQPLNLTVTLKQPLTLGCDVIGIPSPTITWTKDGQNVSHLPGIQIHFLKTRFFLNV